MIELIQIPWSPYCIVQRRVLEFAGVRFKIINIPSQDRSLVWKLTKQRYYNVPIIRDGGNVLFEVCDDTQVIAKYLDEELQLGLFPASLEGVQSILWRSSKLTSRRGFPVERHLLEGKRANIRSIAISAVQGAQVRPRLPGPMASATV